MLKKYFFPISLIELRLKYFLGQDNLTFFFAKLFFIFSYCKLYFFYPYNILDKGISLFNALYDKKNQNKYNLE